jgi:hypothetical protein
MQFLAYNEEQYNDSYASKKKFNFAKIMEKIKIVEIYFGAIIIPP